jgi:hypothetical protein
MTPTTISIPTYPPLKKEEVPAKQTAVEKSLARHDAFAKPGSIGKVRVRTTSVKPKSGNQRQKKHDARKIHWF